MLASFENTTRFFSGIQRVFEGGLASNPEVNGQWLQVATRVPSSTEREDYQWMTGVEGLREWIGPRILTQLSAFTYTIENRNFERSYEVPIRKLKDDIFNIFRIQAADLGGAAAAWPNQLVFLEGLVNGITTLCHDGQNFFDTDHVVNGVTYSNYVSSGGLEAWYLLDTRRLLKPLIFQVRESPTFWSLADPGGEGARMNDRLVYGADARGNVGYGLFHTAFRRHDALNEANLIDTVQKMSTLTNDEGFLLGINPNLLVVGASRRHEADKLKRQLILATGEESYAAKIMPDVLYHPLLP